MTNELTVLREGARMKNKAAREPLDLLIQTRVRWFQQKRAPHHGVGATESGPCRAAPGVPALFLLGDAGPSRLPAEGCPARRGRSEGWGGVQEVNGQVSASEPPLTACLSLKSLRGPSREEAATLPRRVSE